MSTFTNHRGWGPMALGTFEFGSTLPERRCHELLETFTMLGGCLIDTAPTYGRRGDRTFAAETIVGDWLTHTGAQVRVATKAGLDPITGIPNLDPAGLAASAHASAERLRSAHLDLFWLHRDDPAVAIDEIADVLLRLLRDGTVGHIGCSNWQPGRLLELAHALATRGRPYRLTATGPLWSLARRAKTPPDAELIEADADHLDAARRAGLLVVPFRTAALGFFTGRYTGSRQPRHREYVQRVYATPLNNGRLDRARRLGRHLGMSAHQVALMFLRSFDIPVVPIIGATRQAQLRQSAAACSGRLTRTQRFYLTGGQPL
jgi:aryl-alcohol dehydrogenase-like predicted oxidoreductase